jgi:hypothetical protein
VIPEHFADGGAGVPAGIAVIGDVGDAVGRETAMTDVEDLFLYVRRDPRIDAMTKDVIELAPFIAEVVDGKMAEVDVGQLERINHRLAVIDLA